MQHVVQIISVIICGTCLLASAQQKIGDSITFTPIEHGTLVLQDKDITIYVDPVGDLKQYASFPKPSIILITHQHHDHLNPKVIAALKATETTVIGPPTVIDQLKYGKAIKNGEKTTVDGIEIEAVPAYNVSKERQQFHPKGRDNGYVLTWHKQRIYISGDTEDTKEMRQLKNIDFAFVSVNLPYTMTVDQAASAILEMKPKAVSPYHYRGRKGKSDLKKLKKLVSTNPKINVMLLDWYKNEQEKVKEH